MDYDDFWTDKTDKKLDEALETQKKGVKLGIILCTVLLLFLFKGTILFWLKFCIAIPSSHNYKPININSEPIQTNYSSQKISKKTFKYKTLINSKTIDVEPQAHYKISGLTVAYNRSFFIRSKFFDSACLYDIGLAWGKLGEKSFYKKYFTSFSQKNEITGARVLWTKSKTNNIPGVSEQYKESHFSHTHVIPANRNVMAALVHIKVWDKVELEGELVNIKLSDLKHGREYSANTSMTRDDTGMGACEIMYVTKVRIGNTIYE